MFYWSSFKEYLFQDYDDHSSHEYRVARHCFRIISVVTLASIILRLIHIENIQDVIFDVLIALALFSSFYFIKRKWLVGLIVLTYVSNYILILDIISNAYFLKNPGQIHPYQILQTTTVLLFPTIFFSFKLYDWKFFGLISTIGVAFHILHGYALSLHTENDMVVLSTWLAIISYLFMLLGLLMTSRFLKEQTQIITNQKNKLEYQTIEMANKNEILTKFSHIIAHDLKEPQRTINSFLGLLERELDKEEYSVERIKKFSDIVQDGNLRMRQMIESLLDLGTIETNADFESMFKLNDVVKAVKENISQLITETNAVIQTSDLDEIRGDFMLLVQMFQNLIVNAIKYCPPERTPQIKIDQIQTNHHLILISISDNGSGIPKIYLDNIFDVFNRGEHRNTKDGSGIGLSICKKIVELHNGKIWVTSKIDEGSVFYLEFKRDNKS